MRTPDDTQFSRPNRHAAAARRRSTHERNMYFHLLPPSPCDRGTGRARRSDRWAAFIRTQLRERFSRPQRAGGEAAGAAPVQDPRCRASPIRHHMPARLDETTVIYLIFNEGYSATAARVEDESPARGRIVLGTPGGGPRLSRRRKRPVWSLHAASRFAVTWSCLDEAGDLVLLEDQDRRWDQRLIAEDRLVAEAFRGGPGPVCAAGGNRRPALSSGRYRLASNRSDFTIFSSALSSPSPNRTGSGGRFHDRRPRASTRAD